MKKTILITGSTDGIGKLVALRFAKEGHKVSLHGRNPEKLAATVLELKQLSHNEEIEGFVADFSDLSAVHSMSEEISKKISKIDILINNAGVFNSKQENINGIDIRLIVNYLSPVLLTNEILPLIENVQSSRIINLSSAAQSPVSLDALLGKTQLGVNEAYAQSKLALTMWSFALAQQLNNTSVIAVNPGSLLNTKMALEAYGQFWSAADKGSDILYDLALDEKYEGVTEKYFDNDKGSFAQAHPNAYNNSEIENVVKTTHQILGSFMA